MKRKICCSSLCVLSLILGLLLFQTVSFSQKKRSGSTRKAGTITETKATTGPVETPPECGQLVRDFIAYISRQKPDIVSDRQAQNRWLSENLRKGLEHRRTVYAAFVKKNGETPDGPPGNGDFIGSWDYPTTYAIVGVRRYGNRAMVDVSFTWGPKTEYPGDTRLATYVLVHEGAGWKLDDIYTYRGEFVGTSSLNQTFDSESYP